MINNINFIGKIGLLVGPMNVILALILHDWVVAGLSVLLTVALLISLYISRRVV